MMPGHAMRCQYNMESYRFDLVMSIRIDPMLSALEVAERGSVTAAAYALHVSQPALSRTIRELERSLGVELFERRPRGVVPTPAGEALFARARAIRAELTRAERDLEALRSGGPTPLRLGVVRVVAVHLVAEAVLALRSSGVPVSLETRAQAELLGRLAAGELDLVIGPEPPPESIGGAAVTLATESVAEDELVVIARREEIGGLGEGRASLSALAARRWVLPPPVAEERRRLEEIFRTRRVEPPRAWIESDDVPFRIFVVARYGLLSVLARSVAQSGAAIEPALALLPLGRRATAAPIVAVYRAGIEPPVAAREFVAALRGAFRAAPLPPGGRPRTRAGRPRRAGVGRGAASAARK